MDIAAFIGNLRTPAQRMPWTSRSFRKPLLRLVFFDVHNTATRGCFDGLRHDSGDPVWWGEKALAHYAKLRIDAHTKRLVFSDSLNITKALELYRHFADRTQLGFGIGTSLSNDMGLRTLHIVMKLTQADGQPVAKLSDSPGKTMCDDQTFLAYLRQVFGIPAP